MCYLNAGVMQSDNIETLCPTTAYPVKNEHSPMDTYSRLRLAALTPFRRGITEAGRLQSGPMH